MGPAIGDWNSSKCLWTPSSARLSQWSTKSNSTRRMEDQDIQRHIDLGRGQGNSKNWKIDRMLAMNVIKQSQNKGVSAILLVLKDSTLRFCIEYRSLNAASVCDSYPMPFMGECTSSLAKEMLNFRRQLPLLKSRNGRKGWEQHSILIASRHIMFTMHDFWTKYTRERCNGLWTSYFMRWKGRLHWFI